MPVPASNICLTLFHISSISVHFRRSVRNLPSTAVDLDRTCANAGDGLKISIDHAVDCRSTLSMLSPVHISNDVEATGNFVEATFDFVAINGNNGERVYREISCFRQHRMLLRHCCRFWQQCCRFRQQCRSKFCPFDKVDTN